MRLLVETLLGGSTDAARVPGYGPIPAEVARSVITITLARMPAPGWSVTTNADQYGCHTAEFVTPTGARNRSLAPRLPGLRSTLFTDREIRIAVAIAEHAA
ncbi:hypothetical protein [Mycobacterium antarcticum]|uniref:hypothetical protein n=1 Tax=Mycolicibacterium sp. TUM20984 TaxID=3023368 RepID=UPI002385A7BD|nr:hypothetical protein [Mycolicibacterium sp. TUM20984]GLP80889.1 hypothetical protein TUM20984_23090 [Mycolicibacterium sp. TUM20984]